MRVLLLVIITTLLGPYLAVAQSGCTVSKIALLPGPWTNSTTQTSLTVQTQDDGGALCVADQTIRLSFESSGSGQFTNQAGTSLPQAWISTNQANRNFYYVSNTLAADSVTIKAGYGSAADWVETWSVTVPVAELLNVDEETEENEVNDSDDNTNATGESSHSSPSRLSTSEPTAKLEIEAGRDRLVLVGSPVKFKAEIIKENSLAKSPNFSWTFGDGLSTRGIEVDHEFIFPGVHQVILNAKAGQVEAVDRLVVRVVEPQLEFVASSSNEVIGIKNSSEYESNIGNWRLVQGGYNFTFPVDTIVAAGQVINLNSTIMGWVPVGVTGLELVNEAGNRVVPVEVDQSIDQPELATVLEQAKNQVMALMSKPLGLASVSPSLKNLATSSTKKIDPVVIKEEPVDSLVSASTSVIVLRPPQNHLANLLSLPQKSLSWFGDLW